MVVWLYNVTWEDKFNDLGSIREKTFMEYSEVLCQYSPGGNEEDTKNLRLTYLWAKNRTSVSCINSTTELQSTLVS
jgi:hypothetical protein